MHHFAIIAIYSTVPAVILLPEPVKVDASGSVTGGFSSELPVLHINPCEQVRVRDAAYAFTLVPAATDSLACDTCWTYMRGLAAPDEELSSRDFVASDAKELRKIVNDFFGSGANKNGVVAARCADATYGISQFWDFIDRMPTEVADAGEVTRALWGHNGKI